MPRFLLACSGLLLAMVLACGTTATITPQDAGTDTQPSGDDAAPMGDDSGGGSTDGGARADGGAPKDGALLDAGPGTDAPDDGNGDGGVRESGPDASPADAEDEADAPDDAQSQDAEPVDAPDGTQCDGGVYCSNVCVAWWSDPHNCGACGHDCLGTACNAGFCAASPIVTQYVSNRPIALDANAVYFTAQNNNGGTGTGVSSVPKGGGAVMLLAPYDVADGIALDDTFVYYAEHLAGLIRRVPKDGSAGPTTIATGTVNGLLGIGVDATYVYYSDSFANAVYRVAKAGGAAPQPIATSQPEPLDLAVDANGVYFYVAQAGELRRVALDGTGGALSLANNFYAIQIAQSDTDIVYVNQSEVGSVPKAGGGTRPYIELPPYQGVAVAAYANLGFFSDEGSGQPTDLTGIDLSTGNSPRSYYEDWAGNVPSEIAVNDPTWIYVVTNGMLERVAQP